MELHFKSPKSTSSLSVGLGVPSLGRPLPYSQVKCSFYVTPSQYVPTCMFLHIDTDALKTRTTSCSLYVSTCHSAWHMGMFKEWMNSVKSHDLHCQTFLVNLFTIWLFTCYLLTCLLLDCSEGEILSRYTILLAVFCPFLWGKPSLSLYILFTLTFLGPVPWPDI